MNICESSVSQSVSGSASDPSFLTGALHRTHWGKPSSGEAERRPLTVLFADLVGSTGLGERLDPEDLLEVMKVYRDFCGTAITRYGGRIARFLGDGILRDYKDVVERPPDLAYL